MWTFIRRALGARDEPQAPTFVQRINGPDHKQVLFIEQRGDRFTWRADTLTQHGDEIYWAPNDRGGLFASADEAEEDARRSLT
ncbi:MAG TPA: hypothetical protein VM915_13340, partial [Verrucomicrobiae bacterium]|nr:hypothetical protein [Verrucomicrobiae bacterium]